MLVGVIASVLNSVGMGLAFGHSAATVSGYFIGDITGLFACLLVLMLAFKLLRLFTHQTHTFYRVCGLEFAWNHRVEHCVCSLCCRKNSEHCVARYVRNTVFAVCVSNTVLAEFGGTWSVTQSS